MPVIGGKKSDEEALAEHESHMNAQLGAEVAHELKRYRATLMHIEEDAERRKNDAMHMFATRIESIVQRLSPLVSGKPANAGKEDDSPE